MTPETAVHIVSQMFWTTCWLCAPLLLIGFAVGIIVNLIQIATSLQDPTFSTIPRLAAFLLGFLALMPWMLMRLTSYTVSILGDWAAMPGELAIPVNTLYAFLLVLTRVAGVFTFLPLPGFKAGPDIARIVFAVATTLALFPKWPHLQTGPAGLGQFLGWLLMEVILGVAIGLGVAFLMEIIILAAQSISLQAGFSYASIVDPTTNADSTVLSMAAQLIAGLLFFTMGLDGQVLKTFAASLDSMPPGAVVITQPHAEALLMTGATVFTTGLRLALPVITLLLLLDLSVGLLGRLNSQLQVLSLALPLKMVCALAVLSWTVLLFPRVFGQSAAAMFSALRPLLGL